MKRQRFTSLLAKTSSAAALLVVSLLIWSNAAFAVSEPQREALDANIGYFNVEELDCSMFQTAGGQGAGLPTSIPQFWRDLIAGAAAQYPDVDPRLVASVLWAENRGWPDPNTNWAASEAGAKGPWQFIDSTWARMGTDGDGDGIADPDNPRDAVHAAFKHHAGSAGKPIAVQGYDQNASPDTNFQTTVFQRTGTNLLYYAAKYNGSGAPDGQRLALFPRGQNSDYVIMNYWLLATNFDRGWTPDGGYVDAKVTGSMFGGGAAPQAPGPGGISALSGNALCPGASGSGQLVGNVAWPMDKALYDTNPNDWTKPHHDYPAADIPVPVGTPVYAMMGGRIVSAPVGGGCGQGVSIDSGNGITFIYCHGTDGGQVEGARQGDQVQAGQLIMHSGNTGNSTGPHLHLGIKVNGQNRCPQPLFQGMAGGSPPSIESLPSSGCTN